MGDSKDDYLKDLKKARENWEKSVLEPFLEKAPERNDLRGQDGKPIPRLAIPQSDNSNYQDKLGFPGKFPFTRGVYPTLYRGRFWTMRQYAGFASAYESNKRYKYLLEQGQTGLSVAFDLPTQIGYDSDHFMSEGEVGKVGVAIDSLQDMEILFDDIPLDKVSTSMTINSTASILLAMYIALADKRGISRDKLRGTIQNDILKEYIARGTYIFPPKESMRIITDIFDYCTDEVPRWNTISISGYHIREAGATAAQELAFTLADGLEYCKAAIGTGMDIDKFAGRLSFFFNAHNDLLEEVAKFRAARRMWAKSMKNQFNAQKSKSMMLRFHTQTAGSTLTAQQPNNNIIRVAIQTLAAVLGGTQSLHTNSRDEALSLPTEESVRIALRTQQIVAHESGVADTIDPLGGAYYIEQMTDKLESEAQEYIDKIDDMGGMISAIEKGYVQKEIQESAYRYQKEIERNERIVVGVNKFVTQDEAPKNLLKVDKSIQDNQIEKLNKLRSERDNNEVMEYLRELREVASGDGNIMPSILKCVKAYATIGEISDVLRDVFGEYKEHVIL